MTVSAPDDINEVQPAWLSEALASGAKITAVVPEQIGVGEGFAGRVYRIRIDCEGDRFGLPETAIVKLAIEDQVMRAGEGEELYREARFYRDLAEQVDLPHPDVYYADFDTETHAVAIVMQDMGDLLHDAAADPPSIDDRANLLRGIAHMHAQFWNAEVVRSGWLDPDRQSGDGEAGSGETEVLRKAIEADRASGAPHGYLSRCMTLMVRLAATPLKPRKSFTLCHGDFHWRNTVSQGEGDPLVYDWQCVHRGSGAADVAYFLATSVIADERRHHERKLIEVYWRELCERGVTGYPLKEFLREYEEEVAAQLTRIYCYQALIDFSSDPATREHLLANATSMAKDHRLRLKLTIARLLLLFQRKQPGQ